MGGGDEDKSPRCAASAFCVLACASAQKHQNENVLNLRFKWLVKPKHILLQRNQHVGQPLVQNGNNMRGARRLLLRSAKGTLETSHLKHDWSASKVTFVYF